MRILTGLMLTALSFVAAAQAHLDVQTLVQKEQAYINEQGETDRRLVTADIVVPGETVFYTITFTNVSDESAENVVITNPIAEDLVYVEGSAFGPGTDMQFSIDGGASFANRDELTITEEGVTRPAVARDFTHVRWVMQNTLEAGAQATARFAAVLE
ncbi:MAG: DUF11 domain-containing protein [Gammaproteobacteria bacterium]|nr:DUF11 domain-containing protein [Gammaproteobacteria bacterium]